MLSTRNALPEEFSSFINTDKSYSLLIKGLPGTGKSSLALEISIPRAMDDIVHFLKMNDMGKYTYSIHRTFLHNTSSILQVWMALDTVRSRNRDCSLGVNLCDEFFDLERE